jgi:urate oxidase
MPRVTLSSHGEARLRLLRIVRKGDRHDPHDLTIGVTVEDSAPGDREGAPAIVVPGETLKSFVRQAVREHREIELEALGLVVAQRVLEADARVSLVRVEIAERPWTRLEVGAKAQGQVFTAGPPEIRTVAVTSNGARTSVVSGVDDLLLMRSSGFLPRRPAGRVDDGTEDAVPALFVGTLSAKWTHGSVEATCPPYRHGVRAAIVETFALHASRSLGDTLYAIADVMLSTYEGILDVTLAVRERACRPADPLHTSPDTPDDVFIVADEPLGVTEVVVQRTSVKGT